MKLNATKVDSRNVMLVTDFTQSFTGFPLTIAELHQVFDNSSPAPIPTGAPIPTTPPELQETDQPMVTVTPPALPFSLSAFANSGQPAALPLTFILKSQHPKRWLLVMLSPTPPPSTDITNGVAPSIAGDALWRRMVRSRLVSGCDFARSLPWTLEETLQTLDDLRLLTFGGNRPTLKQQSSSPPEENGGYTDTSISRQRLEISSYTDTAWWLRFLVRRTKRPGIDLDHSRYRPR